MASSALDDLRSAAQVLRERAEAATAGSWHADAWEIYSGHVGGLWVAESCDTDDPPRAEGNGRYIATVHPGVGLALAQLLDEHADSVEEDDGQVVTSAVDQAVKLARLILGRADG